MRCRSRPRSCTGSARMRGCSRSKLSAPWWRNRSKRPWRGAPATAPPRRRARRPSPRSEIGSDHGEPTQPMTAGTTRGFADLVDLLATRAEERGDQTAYTFLGDGTTESAQLTYADLDRRARALAATLQGLGLAGERGLLL